MPPGHAGRAPVSTLWAVLALALAGCARSGYSLDLASTADWRREAGSADRPRPDGPAPDQALPDRPGAEALPSDLPAIFDHVGVDRAPIDLPIVDRPRLDAPVDLACADQPALDQPASDKLASDRPAPDQPALPQDLLYQLGTCIRSQPYGLVGSEPGQHAFSLMTSKPQYAAGEPIMVSYTNNLPSSTDWITVVPASYEDNSWCAWFWAVAPAGAAPFAGMPTGSYQVRAYYKWPAGACEVVGRHSFIVQ